MLETLVRETRAGAGWWCAATLDGLAQGLGSHTSGDLGQDSLLKLFEAGDAEVRSASLRVLGVVGLPANRAAIERAAAAAATPDADAALRADSLGLLALGNASAY